MEIYKLVIEKAGSLDNEVWPRIYFNQATAREQARELMAQKESYFNDDEIGSVLIYRERPDNSLGWFVTCGMERIK